MCHPIEWSLCIRGHPHCTVILSEAKDLRVTRPTRCEEHRTSPERHPVSFEPLRTPYHSPVTSLPAAPTRVRWAAVVVWMGVIFWLSSRSTLPQTPAKDYQSVLGHLGAYAILALLLAWALLADSRPLRTTLAIAWLVAICYGVTDEFHQSFVPNRNPDILDVLTDAAGAAIALAAIWWRLRQVRRSPAPETPTQA